MSLQSNLTSVISALDGQSVAAKGSSLAEAETSVVNQMIASGLYEEAQSLRSLWGRIHALLNQALTKATAKKL